MPWWTVNVSGHRLYMMCRLLKSKLKKPLWVHSIHTLHITCYHKLTITTSLLMFTIEKTKSFFPLFLPLHTWGGMRQRPLEVLKQVEAKNLSSSSASLKKTETRGRANFDSVLRAGKNRNKHVHMWTCLFLFVSHAHGTESKLALPLVPVF